jgi:hypothetical protein
MSDKKIDVDKCLCQESSASINVIVKEFARWYCVLRIDKIDHRFNLISMKNMLKKFFSDFMRVTETILNDEFRNNIYAIIQYLSKL